MGSGTLFSSFCQQEYFHYVTLHPLQSAIRFDVITSFSAVYIWSWTTAHRDPRTVSSAALLADR